MALLSLSQGWNCKAITTENSISSQAVKNGINKRNNIYIYTYIYIYHPCFSPLILHEVCNPTDRVCCEKKPPPVTVLEVTLLLMNSIANEALPLFLDQIVPSPGWTQETSRTKHATNCAGFMAIFSGESWKECLNLANMCDRVSLKKVICRATGGYMEREPHQGNLENSACLSLDLLTVDLLNK